MVKQNFSLKKKFSTFSIWGCRDGKCQETATQFSLLSHELKPMEKINLVLSTLMYSVQG